MAKFWTVWKIGGSSPTQTHESLRKAVKEAERLASMHPLDQFAVMESVGCVKRNTVTWSETSKAVEDVLNDNDIPF